MIEEIKTNITVSELASKLGYPGIKAHGAVKSPFRDESQASFSVFSNDQKWKDHGTGEGGDVVDFYIEHAGLDHTKEGYRAAANALCELLSIEITREHLIPPKFESKKFRSHSADPKRSDQIPFEEFRRICQNYFSASTSYSGPGDFFIPDFLAPYFTRKGISDQAINRLFGSGFLGLTQAGGLVYFYEHGAKIRHDINNSSSVRWEYGGAKGNLWRGETLQRPEVTFSAITEGESDAMKLLSVDRMCEPHRTVLGAPGASWSPDPVMSYAIGARRTVALCGDYDQPNKNIGKRAGEEFVKRVGIEILRSAPTASIYAFSWKQAAALGFPFDPLQSYDLCDLDNFFIENNFDNCLIPINNFLTTLIQKTSS